MGVPPSIRAAAAAACLGAVLGGCGNTGPETPRKQPTVQGDNQLRTYTIRGVIRMLPEEGRPMTELQIRHEAIPDFVYQSGKVGMAAMTMPFPIEDKALLEELAVGDKVRFAWEVRWGSEPRSAITQIEKLPPETELVFEAGPPPDGD